MLPSTEWLAADVTLNCVIYSISVIKTAVSIVKPESKLPAKSQIKRQKLCQHLKIHQVLETGLFPFHCASEAKSYQHKWQVIHHGWYKRRVRGTKSFYELFFRSHININKFFMKKRTWNECVTEKTKFMGMFMGNEMSFSQQVSWNFCCSLLRFDLLT